MQTISRYFDLTEAQVARAAVRAGDTRELLRDEYLGSLDWTYLIALGGLRLQVEEPAEAAEAAASDARLDASPDAASDAAGMLAREFALAEESPELDQYDAPNLARVRWWKRFAILVWISPGLIPLALVAAGGIGGEDAGVANGAGFRGRVVARQEIRIGTPVTVEAPSPSSPVAVVFEDDGETGYLYALEPERAGAPIVDAVLVYDVGELGERKEPYDVLILWSDDGLGAMLLLDGYPQAVFDFAAQRGWGRSGLPPSDRHWTRFGHEWSDEALERFK